MRRKPPTKHQPFNAAVPDDARELLIRMITTPEKPRITQARDQAMYDYDFQDCSWIYALAIVPPGRIPKGFAHEGLFIKYLLGITEKCLFIMNPDTGEKLRALSWQYFCNLEIKQDEDFELIGFTWYSSTISREDRLEAGTLIEKSELEWFVLYTAATPEAIDSIEQYWSEMSIPEGAYHCQPMLA